MTPISGAVFVTDAHILPVNVGLLNRFDADCFIIVLSQGLGNPSTKIFDIFLRIRPNRHFCRNNRSFHKKKTSFFLISLFLSQKAG